MEAGQDRDPEIDQDQKTDQEADPTRGNQEAVPDQFPGIKEEVERDQKALETPGRSLDQVQEEKKRKKPMESNL
jgi:hypothetical protein